MKNENGHNELDKFLRETFEGHTIEPDAELWKGIEQRFAPKVVPMQKYSRLKLAFYGSAAVIAGLLFMLVFFRNESPKQNDDLKNELVEKRTVKESIHTKEKVIEKHTEQIAATSQLKNIPKKNAESTEKRTNFFLVEIQPIVIDDFDFPGFPEKEELRNSFHEIKIETVKSSKPINKKNKPMTCNTLSSIKKLQW